MDCYDSNQEDSYDKNIGIIPVQIGFSNNENYVYGKQNSVGTKPNVRLHANVTKYSTKVRAFSWATIVSAILGLLLSALGIALNDKSIGFLSLVSISICGISLMIWVESARRERDFY
jgi:hypothetical protein